MKRVYRSWLIGLLLVVAIGILVWLVLEQKQDEWFANSEKPQQLEHAEQSQPPGMNEREGEMREDQDKDNAASPHAVVTTFKGDPHTTRAFTWHTVSTGEESVLQVVKGANKALFDKSEQGLVFQGTTAELKLHDGSLKGVHKAEAAGLEPNTMYWYRVGNGQSDGWSEPASFTTEASKNEAFTFINVTDSQGVTEQDFELWRQTLDKAFKLFPESAFIVHNGDLTEHPEDDAAWNHLLGKARSWVASYPFMPVTGNHDQVEKKAGAFVSHFNLPDNGSPSTIPGTSYSFDYGPAHFVMLNTESKLKDQALWLKEDLAANQQPWTIVSVHRPAFGGNQDNKVLKHLVPVFDAFDIDLVLQGHNHEYSRSYPLKDGQVVQSGGTIYTTINSSGAKFNKKKTEQFYHKVHFQNNKQMFAAIRIDDQTLTYQAYSIEGELLDEFKLEH